jgi:hypothetical protein
MLGTFFQYGIVLQALAIVHFIRRRPEPFWIWIIIFGGGIGALVYIVAEVVPDVGLLRGSFQMFPRRRRIRFLEAAIVDNPSVANYEELGELYLEDGQYSKARQCFTEAISRRSDSADAFYRRALTALAVDDHAAAVDDLAQVVRMDPRYDYHRAAGLLAHALALVGRNDEAAAAFADVTRTSTLSETQYNYASFLASIGRTDEARDWAQRILAKKPTMPAYMRRKERPWFRKAHALIKKLR